MKKIINFIKNFFKIIFGFIGEFISSKAKIEIKVDIKEIEKIKKEVEYIKVIGELPDEDSTLSIYEERLNKIKKQNISFEVNKIIDETLIIIKSKSNNSLYEYINKTNEVLDMYYSDFDYFISTSKFEYLDELHYKVNKVLKDYYKKEKELEFKNPDNNTKKIDKYNLLKSEKEIVLLIDNINKYRYDKKVNKDIKKEEKIEFKNNVITEENKIIGKEKPKVVEDIKTNEVENNLVEEKEEIKKDKFKEEQEKQNKEKLKKDIDEINKSLKMIDSYILSSDKLSKKKSKGLVKLREQSIKVGLSLFPIALFQNKLIGALTSAVILNNTIRAMRNSINNEIEYKRLTKDDYITNDSINTKIEDTKLDTLNQIALLKSEIKTEYLITNNPELLLMYNDVENMEIELKKKEEKEKTKIKIKTNKY